ncbi:hypothetical protein [Chondromyces apiculatus]|uniref:Quinol:cytochrome c oxidoreductase quinone-binding subunit 2 n=1 Tax=Chondromyces apiculatus DSM 436 TaxID=1192034 RepID=A0A017TDB5_9BACT|nr:hypothetical protein [Chondromyces apiculatus]EYF06917.1 Hypothetical protein CAP_1175 [Chondromyces apiculatus DSM 436]
MIHDAPRFQGGRRLFAASLGMSVLGAAGLLAGLLVNPDRLHFAYLAAFAWAATIATGGLVFLMICHAMRAGWPVALRRLTETIVSALPLLALLFVPLLFGLDRIYPWTHPEAAADEHVRHLLEHKRPYLNATGFVIRAGVYFAVWGVAGHLLRRWSLRRDEAPELDVDGRMNGLSAVGLPVVGLSLVFASFDWLMSLDPTWVSTMFPIYVFAGGFVGALGLLTALTCAAQRAGLLPGLNGSHYSALGRLMLAFTAFWAYAAFFQFLLIWSADHPHEVAFYLRRWEGPWKATTVALCAARFVVPFVMLLSYRLKRRPGYLAVVAAWIVVSHYVDMHWLVIPEARARAWFPYHWLDVAALLFFGGACVAFTTQRLRGKRAMPVGDPSLPRALQYESL